jgi:anhydro-N-acetylmuramic acid kinase
MSSLIELKHKSPRALAIGLMSGTSHDGVSAALCEIDPRTYPPARVIEFATIRYRAAFRARLLAASAGELVGTAEISTINAELGCEFGRAALAIARRARVKPDAIAFIGSHGHTFFHNPPRRARRGETPSTLQLGSPAEIAAATGIAVVADFRPMDIALGGEGAPLAPLGHVWIFACRTRARVIQNIGGIANLTYIPRASKRDAADVIAFDTGPGCGLIDLMASRISRGKMRMDRGGRIAASGRVNESILARLMSAPYFRRRPPKSTGREDFGPAYLDRVIAIAQRARVTDIDLIATLTGLTARSIADAVRRFIVPRGAVDELDELIVAGGGARNPTLMKMLADAIPDVHVMSAHAVGVDGDSLEAVAFAILGYQMIAGRAGNIPSVTGARAPAVLGSLTMPPAPR